ncbi:MAG TPA: amino acid permease [Candidatus Thermoplasmatota archaeon]
MAKRKVPVRAEAATPPPIDAPKKRWLDTLGEKPAPPAEPSEVEAPPMAEVIPPPIQPKKKVRAKVTPPPAPERRAPRVARERKEGPSPAREMLARLFLKKDLSKLVEGDDQRIRLKRTLGPGTLILLGLAGIIGTGIFVLTGTAARNYAGPAVAISFLIAGLVAALAALAYAELSSMIPVSGSAYTYSYAGLGEIVAWVIGWDLVLEYAVGAMVVSQGWAGYVNGLLQQGGIFLPAVFLAGPLEGGVVNLLAVLIVLAVTGLLIYGMQESASVTNALVVVKLLVIAFVIFLGFTLVNDINYVPFIPDPVTTNAGDRVYGIGGIITAAGLVFFAYIGFDALSTTAEEARNPRRDLPISIIVSLAISTVLYILVSLVLVGMEPYLNIDVQEPLGQSFENRGYAWAAALIRIGAAVGITGVLVVLLLSQPRIFYSMARDGLLPQMFARVHPTFRTPWVATLVTGLVVALVAGFVPLDILATVVNIGTLFAFAVVSASVIVLRYKQPNATRGYRVPGPAWLIPGLGALVSVALIFSLPRLTLLFFAFWTGAGLVLYAFYGYNKSHAATAFKAAQPAAVAPAEEAGP